MNAIDDPNKCDRMSLSKSVVVVVVYVEFCYMPSVWYMKHGMSNTTLRTTCPFESEAVHAGYPRERSSRAGGRQHFLF